jgi:hypothetical protein
MGVWFCIKCCDKRAGLVDLSHPNGLVIENKELISGLSQETLLILMFWLGVLINE